MLKNVHFREKILWGTSRDFLFTIDLLIGCLFNSQKVLHVQKRLWRDDIFSRCHDKSNGNVLLQRDSHFRKISIFGQNMDFRTVCM